MTEENGSGYEEETSNLEQQNCAQELYIYINTPEPLGSPLPSFFPPSPVSHSPPRQAPAAARHKHTRPITYPTSNSCSTRALIHMHTHEHEARKEPRLARNSAEEQARSRTPRRCRRHR
jgi:hypothetical protein